MEDGYEMLKLENQLCFPLYACSKGIIRLYRPYLDPLDLTYTQYIAMLAMWESDRISIKGLGERLFLDSGTLTPLLRKLESKGYVIRERSKDDERVVTVRVTEKGYGLRDKASEIPSKIGRCVDLDRDEAVQMHQMLWKLIRQFREE